MADSPLVDLLAHEAAAIRWLDDGALAEFLTDVDRLGWDEARHTLARYRQRGRTWGGDWRPEQPRNQRRKHDQRNPDTDRA